MPDIETFEKISDLFKQLGDPQECGFSGFYATMKNV